MKYDCKFPREDCFFVALKSFESKIICINDWQIVFSFSDGLTGQSIGRSKAMSPRS